MNNLPEDIDYIRLLVSSIDKFIKAKDDLLEQTRNFRKNNLPDRFIYSSTTIKMDSYTIHIWKTGFDATSRNLSFRLFEEKVQIYFHIPNYHGRRPTRLEWQCVSNTNNYVRRLINTHPETGYIILRMCTEVPELLKREYGGY